MLRDFTDGFHRYALFYHCNHLAKAFCMKSEHDPIYKHNVASC